MLPHLYQDSGDAVAEHIDGMFALAIWDDVRHRGVLARDRMGKKPLYYWAERRSACTSRPRSRRCWSLPGFRRELNLEALSHYLSLKHVPHPQSIFKGVAIVPPAHRLVFEPGAPAARGALLGRQLRAGSARPRLCPTRKRLREVRRLLRQGVERRLMSDVPIGFFLSGGLDSSLTTAMAAELASGAIKTFTLTYGDDSTTRRQGAGPPVGEVGRREVRHRAS